MFGWKTGSATTDHQETRHEIPVADEAVQASQDVLETENLEHKHGHTMGMQEDGVLYQEGRVIGERPMVQGAEQALHYLDGVPHVQTPSSIHTTPTTYLQQETVQTPIYTQQETISTPVYSQTTRVQEATPSPGSERTLAVYEAPRTEAPAPSTTLVTVKSISAEERDRQIHEENMRKAQLQEETMRAEAATFMERQKRDTIAFMQMEEGKAQAKYEKEMTNAAYREAQVQKKAADMCAEAAAVRKKAEIAAQQKLEMRRARAKTLAEEALATAKVRTTAIQKGDVKAELTHSWTKKLSRKFRM